MADEKAKEIRKGCGAGCGLIIILFLGYALITGLFTSGKDATPSASDMATLTKGEADLAVAMQDPEKVKLMECAGVKVYKDPQPLGHPPSPAECAQLEQQAGIPAASAPAPVETPAPSTEDTPVPDTSQGDPYADGQGKVAMANYRQHRDTFISEVKNIYFAAGCKVFAEDESAVSVLTRPEEATLEQEYLTVGSKYDQQFVPLVQAAQRDGLDQASKGCDYWQQNPEAVRAMRLKAQLAESGP